MEEHKHNGEHFVSHRALGCEEENVYGCCKNSFDKGNKVYCPSFTGLLETERATLYLFYYNNNNNNNNDNE